MDGQKYSLLYREDSINVKIRGTFVHKKLSFRTEAAVMLTLSQIEYFKPINQKLLLITDEMSL